jgi:hypothetical protein
MQRPHHPKNGGEALAALALVATCAAVALVPLNAEAAELFVSPTGSDSGAGSETAPFATLQKANDAAAAGDTIWLRGGTYYGTGQITLSKSGTSDSKRTKIWAYAGEKPVIDFSKYVTTNSAVDVPAILVTGSYMHLKGIEIANGKVGASGDHSYSLLRTKNASNNTFELLHIHHAFGAGLFIDTGSGGNLILNCDSHDNYDKDGSQGDGQNGDGFGVHYQKSGPSTIIRGCRAWMNSDDGYDFISQEVPVTIESSFAFKNGYGSEGNGNGFKIGSSQTGVRHLVQNNVAWKNKASGFYANHSTGGNTWYNNTSYSNGTQYNMLASTFDSSGNVASNGVTLTGSKVHIMRNNVGFPNKNSYIDGYGVDTADNTWDLGISETSADFVSTSDTGCDGPREADGSIPAACSFLRLKAGSPLIDKGKDVGLPFVGTEPDLGAYEYGATSSAGGAGGGTSALGGSIGAGGVTGSGGRTGGTASGGSGGAGDSSGRRDASPGNGGGPGTGGGFVVGDAAIPGGASGGVSGAGSAGAAGRSAGGGGGASSALGSGGAIGSGGAAGSGPSLGGGGIPAGAGGSPSTGPASSSGCGCRLGTSPQPSGLLVGLGIAALCAARRRRPR